MNLQNWLPHTRINQLLFESFPNQMSWAVLRKIPHGPAFPGCVVLAFSLKNLKTAEGLCMCKQNRLLLSIHSDLFSTTQQLLMNVAPVCFSSRGGGSPDKPFIIILHILHNFIAIIYYYYYLLYIILYYLSSIIIMYDHYYDSYRLPVDDSWRT